MTRSFGATLARFAAKGLLVALVAASLGCGGGASAPAQPASAPAQPASAPASQPSAGAAPATSAAAKPQPAANTTSAAAPPGSRRLMMGTTNSSSSHYAYYVAVAKVVNSRVPGVNVTPVESGAAVENINRMAKGEFDLGLVTVDTLYRAIKGIGPWNDKPVADVRALVSYDIAPQNVVVREDSGVKRLEELSGKEINPGMRGSGTESMTKEVFEVLGLKPKYYVGGTDDALAAVKDKRIVGYVKAQAGVSVPDASTMDLMTATPIRVLSFTPEQVAKVRQALPWRTSVEIPAGLYKAEWNQQPILTISQVTATGTRAALPVELAYQITKALVEDNKAGAENMQASAYPSTKGADLAKRTLDTVVTPLHAGAEKYYRELGLQIPDAAHSPETK